MRPWKFARFRGNDEQGNSSKAKSHEASHRTQER